MRLWNWHTLCHNITGLYSVYAGEFQISEVNNINICYLIQEISFYKKSTFAYHRVCLTFTDFGSSSWTRPA
jgi:hypothetical protein